MYQVTAPTALENNQKRSERGEKKGKIRTYVSVDNERMQVMKSGERKRMQVENEMGFDKGLPGKIEVEPVNEWDEDLCQSCGDTLVLRQNGFWCKSA